MKKSLIKGLLVGVCSFIGMILLLPLIWGAPGVVDVIVYMVIAAAFGGYEFLKDLSEQEES